MVYPTPFCIQSTQTKIVFSSFGHVAILPSQVGDILLTNLGNKKKPKQNIESI